MRTFTFLACLSVMSLAAACGTPSDGYYDANGNWIANNPYNSAHPPLPGGTHNSPSANVNYDNDRTVSTTTTVTTYNYDRRGYYDYNGYYIATNDSLNVPQDMFPPRGMCRVWFTDRTASNQPSVESCNNVQSHVPAGAYVIYGG